MRVITNRFDANMLKNQGYFISIQNFNVDDVKKWIHSSKETILSCVNSIELTNIVSDILEVAVNPAFGPCYCNVGDEVLLIDYIGHPLVNGEFALPLNGALRWTLITIVPSVIS